MSKCESINKGKCCLECRVAQESWCEQCTAAIETLRGQGVTLRPRSWWIVIDERVSDGQFERRPMAACGSENSAARTADLYNHANADINARVTMVQEVKA